MDNHQLRNAIVYICHSFTNDPDNLGSVKLNKILWFSDVEALKERKEFITGVKHYQAKDLGPVIENLPEVIRHLSAEGILSYNYMDFGDYQQWIYQIVNEEKAQQYINSVPQEHKEILNKWIEYARNNVVRTIVDKAHDYPWWNDIKNGNPVPVHLGVLDELRKEKKKKLARS